MPQGRLLKILKTFKKNIYLKVSENPAVLGLSVSILVSLLLFESLSPMRRLLFCLASAVLLIIFSFAVRFSEKPAFRILFLTTAAGLLLGMSFHYLAAEPPWSGLPLERTEIISGTAAADSRRTASGSYMLKLNLSRTANNHGAEADAGGAALVFFREDPQIFMGQELSMTASLSADDDYRLVMQRQRAGNYSVLANTPVFFAYSAVESISKEGWSSSVSSVRADVLRKIKKRCDELGPGAGGLFTALFTGSRDSMSSAESEMFRKAGCSHVLALSGMHLGIISAILLLLLRWLPGRKPAFFISCAAIALYLFLTGFGVSLVRAALMYFFVGISYAFYRKVKSTDVLMLTFVAAVIISPSSFYSLSFQLSFLAVGGIIVFMPIINRFLQPYLPSFLSLAVSCSIAAQIVVSPLLVKVFGVLYPAGLAAGIIIAPLVTVFIWVGIIYLVTGLSLAAAVEDIIYNAIFKTASFFAEIPSVGQNVSPAIVFVLCLVVCALLLSYRYYRSVADGISAEL